MKHSLLCCALLLSLSVLNGCDSEAGKTASVPTPTPSPAAPAVFSQEEAEKLIQRLATQDGCQDSTADMRLSFTDADGKAQQIDFRLQRKFEGGKVSTLMTVLAPKEESEKALLAFEETGQPTKAISYLAGLNKVAQLKSLNPLNFRGSRSSVQEMLSMELSKYEIATISAASGSILVELKAKDAGALGLLFPRIDVTFAEADKQPTQFEFYNDRAQKVKTIQVTEVKTVQNYRAITKMNIEDLRNNQQLKLEIRSIKYDAKLPAALFTEANLIQIVTAASQKAIQ